MSADSSTELEKFCRDHGVHEVLAQALARRGWSLWMTSPTHFQS